MRQPKPVALAAPCPLRKNCGDHARPCPDRTHCLKSQLNIFHDVENPLGRGTSWMGHKTYGRCVQFGSANSFASTTALARSIEGPCGMSPFISALETPQSKPRSFIQNLCSQSGDRRRSTAQHLCSQSGHSGTQKNFCTANQEQETQTMAPRSPTFRRVSLKGRPRLYRGVSA
jgi:hypothetical protein